MPDSSVQIFQSIVERLRRYREQGVDETIAPHDNMFLADRREHYFAVGGDAINIIALAMMGARLDTLTSILDIPCGSGRVMRHLVRFLPEASVVASDIDPKHVEFCVRQFKAEPLLSQENLGQVHLGRAVDLVWCGSLLTHLPAHRFKEALSRMVGWLAPGGIAIVTLHGRWSIFRQTQTPHKYTSDEAFSSIAEGVSREGFGYADYESRLQRVGQESYGTSVSLPSWVMRAVESLDDVRLLDYTERGWDNHQDVLILRKTPIAARPWLFEDRG